MRGVALIFLASLILLSTPSLAAEAKSIYIDVDLDPAGTATVSVIMDVNSNEVSVITVPVKDEDALTVYDETGDLDYELKEGKIAVSPRIKKESYSVMVDYLTDSLTSKSEELWTVTYPFPAYDRIGYDGIRHTNIRIKLPEGAYSNSFSDDAIVSVVDNRISLEWSLSELEANTDFYFEAHYTKQTPLDSSRPQNGMTLALLTLFLAVSIFSAVKRQTRRGIPKAKRAALKALADNERLIVETLVKSGSMTQNELVERSNLHKSTISRAIHALESKGMVILVQKGNTNFVELSEAFWRP